MIGVHTKSNYICTQF